MQRVNFYTSELTPNPANFTTKSPMKKRYLNFTVIQFLVFQSFLANLNLGFKQNSIYHNYNGSNDKSQITRYSRINENTIMIKLVLIMLGIGHASRL